MRSDHCDHAASRERDALAADGKVAAGIRVATSADLAAMLALENKVFATDRMSRRSARRLLMSPHAAVLIAESGGTVSGAAVILFRRTTDMARLYSIAVDPACAGRGIGTALLAAAEAAALARDCQYMRLEVHENNATAIAFYRKAGYCQFGRHERYYQDRGHALRFEKRLTPSRVGLTDAPPYFRQTTAFTGGPACLVMALAWADRSLVPSAAMEVRLWREAASIFMPDGAGGCEPFGMAVTLQRHGLHAEIFVSRPGPYFFDAGPSADTRRVMRIVQDDFVEQAKRLHLPIHLARADDAVVTPALNAGAAAIVLVSESRSSGRRQPHWVFVFGREGRFVLAHDPGVPRDDHGKALAPETYAVPWAAFMRMTRCGRDHLAATILIRKGSSS